MSRPKKPYFKLTIGKAPYSSADMSFGCGRIMVKVSDDHPDARNLIRSMVGTKWNAVCKTVFDVWKSSPPVDSRVALVEPGDWSLAAEVAQIRGEEAAKQAKQAAGPKDGDQ